MTRPFIANNIVFALYQPSKYYVVMEFGVCSGTIHLQLLLRNLF